MSVTHSSAGPSSAAAKRSKGSEGAAALIESVAKSTASDSQRQLFADKLKNEERFRDQVLRQEGVYRVKKENEKLADRLHAALVHVEDFHQRLHSHSLPSNDGEGLPSFPDTTSTDQEVHPRHKSLQSARARAWDLAEGPVSEVKETALFSELQHIEDAYALISFLLPEFSFKDRLYGGQRLGRIRAALERFERGMERAALEAQSSLAQKSNKRGARARSDAHLRGKIHAWKDYLKKKHTAVIGCVATATATESDMRLYLSKAQNDTVFKSLLQKMEREYRLSGLQGSLLGSFEDTGYMKAGRLRDAIERGVGIRLCEALFPPDQDMVKGLGWMAQERRRDNARRPS